jgi:hypothetical protein
MICAWCGKSWNLDGLRHAGWEYLSDRQAVALDILRQFAHARSGDKEFQREASRYVCVNLVEGNGCPSVECGFEHGPGDGPYRQQQMQEIATDDATDDQS